MTNVHINSPLSDPEHFIIKHLNRTCQFIMNRSEINICCYSHVLSFVHLKSEDTAPVKSIHLLFEYHNLSVHHFVHRVLVSPGVHGNSILLIRLRTPLEQKGKQGDVPNISQSLIRSVEVRETPSSTILVIVSVPLVGFSSDEMFDDGLPLHLHNSRIFIAPIRQTTFRCSSRRHYDLIVYNLW